MNISNTNSKPSQETKVKPCAVQYVLKQLNELNSAISEHRTNKTKHLQMLGFSASKVRNTPDPILKKFEAKKTRLTNTLKFLQR